MNEHQKKMTLIVFSNDMDRALTAFILATGAASAGMNVTMYFTFWGLALLRKNDYDSHGKSCIERIFGWILPKGPDGTHLSKMNFLGAGTFMMRGVMRTKKMPQLTEFMNMAVSMNVKIASFYHWSNSCTIVH